MIVVVVEWWSGADGGDDSGGRVVEWCIAGLGERERREQPLVSDFWWG